MAASLKRVKVAPKGMGLNDFVAMQEGFFAAEGLDVEFDWKTFRGTQSSWKGLEYFQRPQDQPYTQAKEDVIQGACVWGTICNASAGMGRIVADAFGDSPWAIFVRPDSGIRKPEDLKDVEIAVGMRAGSHFNVPYRLEKYLPLANIKTVNTGGFGARLKALLGGEVEAASLLPPQIAMAEQLGLRKIIEDRFHTLWWVPEGAAPEVVRAYLNALQRAEDARDAARCADREVWVRMGVSADHRAADHGTEVDQDEIERPDAPLEVASPQGEAKHVGREVQHVGMQEAVGDEAPVFPALDCRRIHRPVAEQELAGQRVAARLPRAQRKDDDIRGDQHIDRRVGAFEEPALLPVCHARQPTTRASIRPPATAILSGCGPAS